MSAPILRFPQFSLPFFIYVDVCGVGLGAVLMQRDEERRDCAVAYASRAKCVFHEYFRPYIEGLHITVFCDHSSCWCDDQTQLVGWLGGYFGCRTLILRLSINLECPTAFLTVYPETPYLFVVSRLTFAFQFSKPSQKKPGGFIVTIRPQYPWENIGVDFVGPLPWMQSGNAYILVFVDYFSK